MSWHKIQTFRDPRKGCVRWWGGVDSWRPGSYLFKPSEDLDLGVV